MRGDGDLVGIEVCAAGEGSLRVMAVAILELVLTATRQELAWCEWG